MGCDIHSRAEIKVSRKWVINEDPVFKNAYEWQIKEDGEFCAHPSDMRNYDWFAILADVRNGRGFAGIKTGQGFVPISQPRGVPHNASAEWKQYVREWGADLHSTSWLDVDDFDDYNWNQVSMKVGVITIKSYEELRGSGGPPEEWCGSVSGGKIITVSMEQADEILAGNTITAERERWESFRKTNEQVQVGQQTDLEVYVRYNWAVHYREWFASSIEHYVEPLRKLKEKYGDARLVFGFDN